MLISMEMVSSEVSALFKKHPNVRLASLDDAGPLARFYNETIMNTGRLQIGFNRGTDYFSLLRLQGAKFTALVCEEDGQIVGVGAVAFRKSTVRGISKTIGYLQDLRVSLKAKQRTRIQFYACFSELVRICPTLPEFDCCALFVTAILDENHTAKAALSRTSFPLEYSRLNRYKAHVWPKPFPTKLRALRQNSSQDRNSKELIGFYESQLGSLPYDITLDDLERFTRQAHPVVLRSEGIIIAACLLVQTDLERRLRAALSFRNLQFESSGTYLTALRVSRKATSHTEMQIRQTLIKKALRESFHLPGIFTGYISSEDGAPELTWLQSRLSAQVGGSIYRVYHPEHTKIPGFTDGFLRPSHVPVLDWVLL